MGVLARVCAGSNSAFSFPETACEIEGGVGIRGGRLSSCCLLASCLGVEDILEVSLAEVEADEMVSPLRVVLVVPELLVILASGIVVGAGGGAGAGVGAELLSDLMGLSSVLSSLGIEAGGLGSLFSFTSVFVISLSFIGLGGLVLVAEGISGRGRDP